MGTIREELKFAWKYKPVPGEYGIEIEAEVKSPGDYPVGFLREVYNEKKDCMDIVADCLPDWDIHVDSSLRNYGLEYVFKKPLDFNDALKSLEQYREQTKNIPFIKNSPSTSVHVHVNIANETALTMGNFLTAYMLYENILIEFSGELRRSNLFALPTRVAEQTARNIAKMFRQYEKADQYSINYNPENVKYAALNLACLTSLGSLEIRSFRGTTDVQEIKRWLSIINRMLIFSRMNGLTPRDILKMYRYDDNDLFHNVFAQNASILRGDIPQDEFDLLIEKNLWFAKEIADSVKDWNKISTVFADTPRLEKKSKEKVLVIDSLEDGPMLPPAAMSLSQLANAQQMLYATEDSPAIPPPLYQPTTQPWAPVPEIDDQEMTTAELEEFWDNGDDDE